MGQEPGGLEKFRVVVARPVRDAVGGGARASYFHPTRIQAPDKETNTRQGSKHSTRKQALNKATGAQQGNRYLFAVIVSYVAHAGPIISHDFLICSKCWSMMYYTHFHVYFPNSPRNICADCNHIQKRPEYYMLSFTPR